MVTGGGVRDSGEILPRGANNALVVWRKEGRMRRLMVMAPRANQRVSKSATRKRYDEQLVGRSSSDSRVDARCVG